MKKLFALLLTMGSFNSFATQPAQTTTTAVKNNYMISASIYVNDKKMNTAQFGVTEGEKGSIEMKEKFLTITSIKPDTTYSKNAIKMSFEVGNINEKGEKIIIAAPTVSTDENKMATLTVASNNGQDTYKIELTPRKITK